MKTLKLEVPDEVVKIAGSIDAATKEAKEPLSWTWCVGEKYHEAKRQSY